MSFFTQLLLLIGLGLLVWYIIRTVRGNPEMFSKIMFNKSFYTMGILAIILIAFIAVCIALLRAS